MPWACTTLWGNWFLQLLQVSGCTVPEWRIFWIAAKCCILLQSLVLSALCWGWVQSTTVWLVSLSIQGSKLNTCWQQQRCWAAAQQHKSPAKEAGRIPQEGWPRRFFLILLSLSREGGLYIYFLFVALQLVLGKRTGRQNSSKELLKFLPLEQS